MSKRAVILAGGLGTRLKPFTEVIPKPLLPIGEKSILEIQIEHLRQYGFNEIYLATNYKSEYIENFFGDGSRYGIKLTISKEEKALGTAGPLKFLEKHLKDAFIVTNGDILSSIDYSKIYSFASQKDTLLTVAVKKIVTPYDFGNIFFEGDYVVDIQEKPNFITYALAGIYVMKPEILNLIPDNEYYGIDVLMKKMLEQQIPIAKYEMSEYWLDIGQIEDYKLAQEAYEKHIRPARKD